MSEAELPQGGERSRLAKILRRTWVGGGLALVVALAIWQFADDARVVLAVGTALSLAAILELGGMGSLAGRGIRRTLLPAATGLFLLNWALVRPPGPGLDPARLAASYAAVLLVATVAFVELRFTLWRRVYLTTAALALGACFAFLDELELELQLGWGVALALAGAWVVVLLLAASVGRGREGGRPWTHLGLALWLVFPLPALVHVQGAFGTAGLVLLIVLSKIGDIAAYYAGNAIGRHHPFPRLSPGKTIEGCAASLIVATLVGGASATLISDLALGWWGGCLAGLTVNLAAQAGDLLESAVKRRAGVKDSGRWFGPSGGVLDLVDSLLLSVPTALVVWPLLFQ